MAVAVTSIFSRDFYEDSSFLVGLTIDLMVISLKKCGIHAINPTMTGVHGYLGLFVVIWEWFIPPKSDIYLIYLYGNCWNSIYPSVDL